MGSIWSLALFANRMLHRDMEHITGVQQFSTVSFVAAEVDHDLQERFNGLQAVAASITPQAFQKPGVLQTRLEQLPFLQSMFNAGAYFTDTTGMAVASVPVKAARVGLQYMDRAHVRVALMEGRATVSDVAIGKALHAPVFSIAVPVYSPQGTVLGALVGVVNLDLPNFLDSVTNSHYGKTGGYLLVSKRQRLVVTSSDRRRVMQPIPAPEASPVVQSFVQGYEGSTVFVNSQGVEVLASVKGLRHADWLVAVSLPTREAFASIAVLQKRVILATAVLTLLAGLLTLWMVRRQLAPMAGAARALKRLSESGEAAQFLPVVRKDEIGTLIGGFNTLLAGLKERETALEEGQERYRSLVANLQVGVLIQSGTGRVELSNFKALELLGLTLDQLKGKTPLDPGWNVTREDGTPFLPAQYPVAQAIATRQPARNVVMGFFRPISQDRVWLLVSAEPQLNAQGEVRQVIALFTDITERKQAQDQLQLAASVFTHTREAIMVTAVDGSIIDVNQAFCRITGYSREEVLGQNPRILASGRQKKDFYATMWKDLAQQGHWYGEVWNRRKNGEVYAEMQTISTVCDAQGRVQHYVALFSDITSSKEQQQKLERIAHFDALTGLPNRVLFADRMQQGMAQALRRGRQLAVAFLDLDGFKAVNDQHGHDVGDQLLIALSTRMKHVLREGDTLARLGGDEFVVVMGDFSEPPACVPLLSRLLGAAAQVTQVGELSLQVSASLGVTFYPQSEEVDADQLLRQADQAMYQAKLGGKNRYHVFDAEQDRNVRGHHESLDRIQQALLNQEFVLHYQPKVNLRTGAICGVEALIRWQHPEQGLLAPAGFLPVVEDHPLAVDIGEWVIDAALAQIQRWQGQGLVMEVSVNIGARQLQQANFVDRLRSLLAQHPEVEPARLSLEVLETSALDDVLGVSQRIETCKSMGILFALDDFGTGYSSLTYLKRLPATLLKIDQSFVRDMLDNPDDLAILEGIIGLASAFGREVIAEGVETMAHGERLLALGCDLAQGYGIARPMPAAQLPQWCADWTARHTRN